MKSSNTKVKSTYSWGPWGGPEATFTGVQIKQLENYNIETDMEYYVGENVKLIELSKANTNGCGGIAMFRALIRVLVWCVTQI